MSRGTNPGILIPGPNDASPAVITSIRQIVTKIGFLSIPVISTITLSSLTANRLMASDASKALVSTDLVNWVTGTTDQITVSDDGDGTITISGPQNLGTGSSPSFVGLGIIGVADETERLALDVNPGFVVYQQDTGELYLNTVL